MCATQYQCVMLAHILTLFYFIQSIVIIYLKGNVVGQQLQKVRYTHVALIIVCVVWIEVLRPVNPRVCERERE